MPTDALADFSTETVSFDGTTRTIFKRGSGPAVIVMAEIPGITPKVAAFARRVADAGFTAVLPRLFGVPGRDPYDRGRAALLIDGARALAQVCISREFTLWATHRTSPVVSWLRALAASEHERCGGPGVGAVGMCVTGGFALAMAAHPSIVAPVLSQPSLPLAFIPGRAASIDCSRADLDRVRRRCETEGLTVLGLRFQGDRMAPAQRFAFLQRQLGDAFVAVELPDSAANPTAVISAHSVLTEHLIDQPGEPTHAALEQVLDLFRARLAPAT